MLKSCLPFTRVFSKSTITEKVLQFIMNPVSYCFFLLIREWKPPLPPLHISTQKTKWFSKNANSLLLNLQLNKNTAIKYLLCYSTKLVYSCDSKTNVNTKKQPVLRDDNQWVTCPYQSCNNRIKIRTYVPCVCYVVLISWSCDWDQ